MKRYLLAVLLAISSMGALAYPLTTRTSAEEFIDSLCDLAEVNPFPESKVTTKIQKFIQKEKNPFGVFLLPFASDHYSYSVKASILDSVLVDIKYFDMIAEAEAAMVVELCDEEEFEIVREGMQKLFELLSNSGFKQALPDSTIELLAQVRFEAECADPIGRQFFCSEGRTPQLSNELAEDFLDSLGDLACVNPFPESKVTKKIQKFIQKEKNPFGVFLLPFAFEYYSVKVSILDIVLVSIKVSDMFLAEAAMEAAELDDEEELEEHDLREGMRKVFELLSNSGFKQALPDSTIELLAQLGFEESANCPPIFYIEPQSLSQLEDMGVIYKKK